MSKSQIAGLWRRFIKRNLTQWVSNIMRSVLTAHVKVIQITQKHILWTFWGVLMVIKSSIVLFFFTFWHLINNWPLDPSTPLPLGHQPPTNICASTITTNSHHSACPWPQVLGLMLTPTCTIFLPKWSGGNSNSKLWPLISQHFLNRNACCLGE